MGGRSSKSNRNSYDIAPVVSNKDFTYKKHSRAATKVQLPGEEVNTAGNNESAEDFKQEQQNKCLSVEKNMNGNAVGGESNEIQDPRIPEWVNENNFKKLLLKSNPDIKDITSFKAFPALAAGENYATLMLRVKITAKLQDDSTKDFSFMLKIAHNIKEMQDIMQAMHVLITENTVYTEVLPELEEMYRQKGIDVKFGPNSHRLELEDTSIHYVLLDDLSVDGFKNANRLECLDKEHTLGVLRKMALFHAASACRVAKKGSYPAVFSPDVDNEMTRAMMQQMFMAFKKPFLENLKTYKNGEKYYDLMDNFFDNLIELFVRSRKLLPGYFCVLNHGDSWSNNILFKYSKEGVLDETLFVDFQNTNWSSPAVDLYYFIISSVQIDIKLSQFDYFIRYYHEHLSQHMQLLEYPLEIPSLRDFQMQLIDFGSMATMTSFFTLGVVLLDPTESAKFENFLGDTEESYNFKNSMYSNGRYRKYINEILPWLYDRGFMEINFSDLDKRIAAADKLKELQPQQTVTASNNMQESINSYPEWINESLFFDVVRADCENYQKILQFSVGPAKNGTDYQSLTLLQVDIDIELTDHTKRNLSYLMKIPAQDGQCQTYITNSEAFIKESVAYFEIIPQLEKICKERAGIDVVFAPRSFKLKKNTETDALVLENMRQRDFKYCDPLVGLDVKHTEAVLKKLAQFHAASACLFEAEGIVPEEYTKFVCTKENAETRENMIKSLIETFLEYVKQHEDNEDYIYKIKNFAESGLRFLDKASSIDNNKFNVLNQGACWNNNLLFQQDQSEVIKNVCFVDFHLVQYGSPCYDLFCFLLSSPKLEIKLEYFDYFIRYYHENLESNLELLKYSKPIPSLKDLHLDLLDSGVWAFYTVMCILPAVLLDSKDKQQDSILAKNDDSLLFKKELFFNKRYCSHTQTILPWLNQRGLLDFN